MRRKSDRPAAISAKMFSLNQMQWVHHVFVMSCALKIMLSMVAQLLAQDAQITFKSSVWMQKSDYSLKLAMMFALMRNLACAYCQTSWTLLLRIVCLLGCSSMPNVCDGGCIAGLLAYGVEFEYCVSRARLLRSNY